MTDEGYVGDEEGFGHVGDESDEGDEGSETNQGDEGHEGGEDDEYHAWCVARSRAKWNKEMEGRKREREEWLAEEKKKMKMSGKSIDKNVFLAALSIVSKWRSLYFKAAEDRLIATLA